MVKVLYQVGHSTRHIHLLHNLPIPKPTNHMKRRRINLSSELLHGPARPLRLILHRASAPRGKGMQLGKKSKTTDMFERVRGDMGAEVEETASSPLIPNHPTQAAAEQPPHTPSALDRDAIHVTISESINAKLSRDGSLNSLEVKGDLNLRISDPTLTKVKLDLVANQSHGVQFRTHPNVDKGLFSGSKAIQMSNVSKGFPVNNSVGVLRWRAQPKTDDTSALPIQFTVWVVGGQGDPLNITVEYELTGEDPLQDVTVTIPYASSEPSVSSFDATYEVSGDSLEWTIGSVDSSNGTGSFEFEVQDGDENDFFPMQIKFAKTNPFIDVDVSDPQFLLWRPPETNDHSGYQCHITRIE